MFYNCHTHIFTAKQVPKHFLPFGLIRWLSKSQNARSVARFLSGILGTSDDIFDRWAAFIAIGGGFKNQLEIFEFLRGFYPDDTRFIVLSMDMEYMAAGEVPIKFEQQLDELSEIEQKYGDLIFPFICVDPRRKNIKELVVTYIEKHHFSGIKLYPPLGYYPFDERLEPIYEYAQEKNIPIMTHCSRGGVYYRGKITDEMLVHPKTKQKLERKGNKDFTDNYSDPNNYKYVLEKYPKLKICLAHFGGEAEWKKHLATSWDPEKQKQSWFSIIVELIKKYDNVYTDISYTMQDVALIPLLKVILQEKPVREKVLYGTDFYMVELDRSEKEFSINLRAHLGEPDFQQIAVTNPQKFL